MKFWSKLKALFRRRKLDAEMAEEMRLHLEFQTEKNLAAGMSAEDARYAARRQFGGVEQVKERCREQRGWVGMEQVLKDLRFAVRGLAKAKGFTTAVVATLAIGIGATTAMVSLARTILFARSPFPEAERLVVLARPDPLNPLERVPYPLFFYSHRFVALRASTKAYAALGTQRRDFLNLVVNGEPAGLDTEWVSEGFFPALGVRPYLGRLFVPEDFRPGKASAVVLSWGTWTARFESDPGVLGREILLGGQARRVIGVLDKDFMLPGWFGGEASAYLPEVHSAARVYKPLRRMQVIGRLREGVSIGAAQAELTTFQFPDEPPLPPLQRVRQIIRVVPLRAYSPSGPPSLFWLFLAAVGGLFAISCANAANLLLARTIGRSRELGVRLALGGGRWRIVRLVFTETLLLALAGGGVGLFVAWASRAAMKPLLMTASAATADTTTMLETKTIAVAFGLSLLACVLASGAPAWRIWRAPLNDLLKDGFGSLGDSQRLRRLRKGLVVVQAALAVALTIGTVLMTRSVWRVYHTDLGFKTENRFVVMGQMPAGISETAFLQLSERAQTNLATLPGVRNVTLASTVPLVGGGMGQKIKIVGQPDVGTIFLMVNRVAPEYFGTLGLPILSGQGFDGTRPGGRLVTVISRTAAKRYFPDRDPVGQWLDAEEEGKWEIIGVVEDVRMYDQDVGPQLYVPFWQPPVATTWLTAIVLLDGRPTMHFEATVRQMIYAIDPGIVVRLTMLSEPVAEMISGERKAMIILQVLGGLAVALAAFGLFAVMAYAVAQRRREFGVRLALGAEPGNLRALVLREGAALAAIGVALGAGVAWSFTPLLKALLFKTGARDPITFVVGPLLLILVALVACWLPARRAAKVDPMVALRCE